MFSDSAGLQFFMHKKSPHLYGHYAKFGKVTEGLGSSYFYHNLIDSKNK